VLVLAGCAGDHHDRGRAARLAAANDDAERAAEERWRRPDLLVAALGLRPGQRVADVGAGTGTLEPALAAAVGPRGLLVATDVDGVALDALRRRTAAAGVAVDARLVTADWHGLEAGGYDLILLAQVDHLLADPAGYLRRLRAALAPGGRIAIANRIDRQRGALAAARAAGLRLVGRFDGLPAQFVLLLDPGGT